MKKKALISIVSNQFGEDNSEIEVVTPGEFTVCDDGFKAVYQETEISGMEGTVTRLLINDNSVSLEREGTTTSKMYFEKDKSDVSLYDTPYGTLELKIKTNELEIDLNENGGNVFIDYKMIIGDQSVQNTKLKINIKSEN
ncbi:MAG: DUF1934 domain-containing protein [Inconstantimicrobium porci]|uniref:DUF1934 domain-containing protein n=1 Tax=Inconstantimicrobium porci TaxID=2652291 RepID=UPI00240A7D99|nr:DUF1934 domain-containing protein [Inconstantimicrobium porci]MDD6770801.1 DUF1934 domain-containing protein [Inconstantimicrobium porci]MDY5911065.1 DUF1934 domain-containing protein [Inconstantimicrobium porci]